MAGPARRKYCLVYETLPSRRPRSGPPKMQEIRGSGADVPAARNALRILSFLATQRGPVPPPTVAHALGLPRSSVYRLLAMMQKEGFVLHFPEDRRYGVGVAAFELSS